MLSKQETTPVVYDTVVPLRLTLYRRVLRARTLEYMYSREYAYSMPYTYSYYRDIINYFIMHLARSTMHILVILYELVILQ